MIGMLGIWRANRNLVVFLVAIILMEIVHGIEAMALFPLYLTQVLGSSVTVVGAVISIYLLVDIATRTPAGWLADRWGRKTVLMGGILLSILSLTLMLGARDPRIFLLLNGFNGLGAGCIWPAVYAGVADTYRRSERGLILGALSTVMLGGLALGPITGNILLGLTSYRAGFFTCIALAGVVLVVVLSLATESRQAAPHTTDLALTNGFRSLTGDPVQLGCIALLLTVSLALLLPIISLYGSKILGVDKVTMGLMLAVPGAITALALLPAGYLSDCVGRKPPIVTGLAMLTVCYAAAPATTNLLVVAAGATCAGLGYALAVPAWNALAMDRVPQGGRGLPLGAVATVQGAGLAAGPLVGGYLWEHINPYAPFTAGAFVLLVATLISSRIKPEQ